jgi:hypothetical protein
MDFSISFVMHFMYGLYLIGPLLIFLLLIIVGMGQYVGRVERWTRFDAFYWSLITAMTVGYGDIRPTRKASKSLSLVIAFTGLVLSGITVAIALQAATLAFHEYGNVDAIQKFTSVKNA